MQQESPFIASTITLCFLFSTMYGMAYLYAQGAGQVLGIDSSVDKFVNGNKDPTNAPVGVGGTILGFTITIFDGILEAASWISPMALIKGFFVISGLNTSIAEVYDLLNLFVLRPMGWAMSLILINYILNRVWGED